MNHPNLDGQWQAQSAELAGSAFPAEVTKTIFLKLSGESYEMQNDRGTSRLLEGNKMEITGNEGPNKGKVFKAIYKL
ncbi:MAG: hypothetical protein HOP08_20320 [Cyclobacteriaceae bacterium]|nr:hypothetical protein [Cyclobacteriaceae bacterium]